ncbi:MAG: hypothetical protein WD185_01965, partial [Sneathiella sp.]
GATFYNGMISRRIQEEEKLNQARNNAVILVAELNKKLGGLGFITKKFREIKPEETEITGRRIFEDRHYIFDEFSCEKDPSYFAGLPISVIRQFLLVSRTISGMEEISEILYSQSAASRQIGRIEIISFGEQAIKQATILLHLLNVEYKFDE